MKKIELTLNDLHEAPYNPRKISQDALKGLGYSLNEFGDISGIVWNRKTKHLVCGHQRIKVLKEQFGLVFVKENALIAQKVSGNGEKHPEHSFPIRIVDWNKYKEMAANIAANNQYLAGEFTEDLSGLLEDVKLNLPDEYEELNLDNLLEDYPLTPTEGLTEDDDIPTVPEKPKSKTGDLYILGKHRLLCGDATKKEDVERLMNEQKADMVLTDPPYGVDYSGKNEFLNARDKGNHIQIDIENDAIENYRTFFGSFLKLIPFADYNILYIFMSGKELHNLRLAMDDTMCVWGDYLVWLKNNHVLGRKDYNSKHEFVVYGWKGKHKFYGDFSTTLLEFDKPLKSELHPTMKPVELLVKLLGDGSLRNSLVYDAFLGSGSVLIACEKTNRKCYGMEIDPHYCDVIVKRWEDYTGNKAELIRDKKVA